MSKNAVKPQRNLIAAGLSCGQFQPRTFAQAKGRGSFRRAPKHRGQGWN